MSDLLLSDICKFIVDCEHKTAPLSEAGYPSIRTPNVGRGRLILRGVNRVDEKTYVAWTRRAIPQEGDLIIAREAPIGNVALVTANQQVCLGQRTVLVRPDVEKVDSRYLTYFLLGDYAQNVFRSKSIGATVPHLNMADIRGLKLPILPPRENQQRIGEILSAYDDLIEVNQRRTAILEDMARRLFDEWFVHFRYPGHMAVPLVETELGTVPKGWNVVRAEGVIDFGPRTIVPKEGIKRFVPMGSLDTVSSVISDWETRSGNSGSKFQNGDTLFARITPCLENGKTGLVNFLEMEETAFGSTEFTVMRGKGVSPVFVYLLARSEAFRAIAIKSMGGADGRQRVRTEALKGYEFACPTEGLLTKFASIAEPMLQQVRVLADHNSRLRDARDLLLPKLISGEIDLLAAEETFAEAAE